ncbi:MAG: isoprenylcysteine carboxylmethyltransferase family protein [Alphaproteobacteria bacterium]|nr:isoprenylcysteine carboxylmethyltransferase family protein [Alphaproteobacteria bacterium]MBL6939712.1 isoprenylcysteine carboxylmethyltransferase family protein [Alphaproteobacteria bacterium]MBL7096966.1 isoprenylcysteine carboxylmethyltransferase family protein [Alphaproteobacteria bacterium]
MNFARFRSTKSYDALTALPLVLWYVFILWRQVPFLRSGAAVFEHGDIGRVLQYLSLAGAEVFYFVVVMALLARTAPTGRSDGVVPRAVAIVGTFMSVAILYLPPATLPLAVQALANGLIFGGCVASALIVWALGRNFSVFPEARGLVMRGPYAWARHPLYTAESLIVIGTAIQFAQPWAGVLGVANLGFVYWRTVYEERVLTLAHPEYAAYRARTARFLPGVF